MFGRRRKKKMGLKSLGQGGEELVCIRHVLFKIMRRIEKAEFEMSTVTYHEPTIIALTLYERILTVR